MGALLGLVVAAAYGAADFFGGLASRRARAAVAVTGSQLVGLVALLGAMATFGDHVFDGPDVARGAGAGLAGVAGVGLLYRGLSRGLMSVVAPVTAAGAAIVPFLWGIAQGERPGPVAIAGAVVAVAGVTLVARTDSGPVTIPRSELVLAVLAGIGFGGVFVLLGETSPGAGLWPVVAARLTSVPLAALVVVLTHQPWTGIAQPGIVAAGALDATANATFLLAAREGLLSEVAVISALYPASTLLLARLVLGERVSRLQGLGLVAVLAGVVLIAL